LILSETKLNRLAISFGDHYCWLNMNECLIQTKV
jgi:hypothetical protein